MSLRGWLTAAAVFTGAYLLVTIVAGALSAFILLFAAILFAAGLRPMVDRLSTRVPYAAALGVTFGAVLLVLILIAYLLAAPVVAEAGRFYQAIPSQISALQDRLAAAQRFIQSHETAQRLAAIIGQNAGSILSVVAAPLLQAPVLLVSIVSNAVIIVLLAFGWVVASKELSTFVLSLLPQAMKREWQAAFDVIDDRMSAYVQGVALNGTLVGIVVGAALALLGVPYALLLGFVTAILQGIPMIGAVISGAILLLAVLATGGWVKMLVVLVVFTIVQIIDQNVVSPLIFGERMQLSFLLIVFSTVLGGMLLGISGAFLAVPAAAVLQVIVTQIVAPAVRRANQSNTDDGPAGPP